MATLFLGKYKKSPLILNFSLRNDEYTKKYAAYTQKKYGSAQTEPH
jgi:hypothetical protein